MGELGSIFGPDDGTPSGPDLRVTVRIPAVRDGSPVRVHVPLSVAHEGGYVRRADPHGDGDEITLSLPPSLPEGAVLRLRGLGGASDVDGGRAGDLYVAVEVVQGAGDLVVVRPPVAGRVAPWLGGAAVLAAMLALRACVT